MPFAHLLRRNEARCAWRHGERPGGARQPCARVAVAKLRRDAAPFIHFWFSWEQKSRLGACLEHFFSCNFFFFVKKKQSPHSPSRWLHTRTSPTLHHISNPAPAKTATSDRAVPISKRGSKNRAAQAPRPPRSTSKKVSVECRVRIKRDFSKHSRCASPFPLAPPYIQKDPREDLPPVCALVSQ
jgi:hypothetical protein